MAAAVERLAQIGNQISSKIGKQWALHQSDNDVVIVAAARTPLTKAKKGGLKDTPVDEMLLAVYKAVIARSGISPELVEDVVAGTVLSPGGGANQARMAALAAGFPNTTSVMSLNRQCSSGLQACALIANAIVAGQIDVGVGSGVDSMSNHYGAGAFPPKFGEEVLANQEAEDCLIPMGITSENVAQQYGITRKAQDEFAASSFQKAAAAQKAGKFVSEIIPMKVKWTDPKTEEEKDIVVSEDDGIRDGVTAESLSKLKPAFSKTGTTHAGNASQVTDGAAAIMLARRSVAKKLGLPILGKFVTAVTAGVPPKVMGIGPAVAIPKLLKLVGINQDEIDFWEINEAFASQAVYCVQELGIDPAKVNPAGGAIAFGHPLGCTGARQIATGFAEAKRTGAKLFVSSMCIGSGMGMAALYTNEQ